MVRITQWKSDYWAGMKKDQKKQQHKSRFIIVSEGDKPSVVFYYSVCGDEAFGKQELYLLAVSQITRIFKFSV